MTLLAASASAFTPDTSLPNCFMAGTSQHTFCDSTYYGSTATVPAGSQLQPGKCYIESRGAGGELTGYSEIDCANADKTTCESAPTTPGCGSAFSNNTPCDGGDYCGFVDKYINPVLNFLAIGFGLIVTITVVVSGIQYITSGGNPQAIGAAKKRIFNAVLSLLLFIFMWALLQWLVPGGLF